MDEKAEWHQSSRANCLRISNTKAKSFRKSKMWPLSARKAMDRSVKMATGISRQQMRDVNSAPGYTITCDELGDVDDVAQVLPSFAGEMDNTTFAIRHNDGHRYYANFEYAPFLETESHLVYRGRLNGKGPKAGDYCAVKIKKEKSGESALYWDEYVKRATLLSKNVQRLELTDRLEVIEPYLAEIDEISFWNKIPLFRGKRKLRREHAVVEPYVRGGHLSFDEATVPRDILKLLQALSHFSYCWSDETMLITGFGGVVAAGRHYVTTHDVHFADRKRGTCGRGQREIDAFLRSHSCDHNCVALGCSLGEGKSRSHTANIYNNMADLFLQKGRDCEHPVLFPHKPEMAALLLSDRTKLKEYLTVAG